MSLLSVETGFYVGYCKFRIWEDLGLELDPSICESVLMDVVSDIECIRHSVAVAVCKILEQDSIHLDAVLQLSMKIYQERLYVSFHTSAP